MSALVCAAVSPPPVRAQSPAWYSGEVIWLEVWRNGNVAFRMPTNVAVPCNGQFVLNKSDPGTKNQYATLVAAKLAGRTVTVYFDVCGPAEGYGASYAQVAYLYLN
jgi:hypothetical protein